MENTLKHVLDMTGCASVEDLIDMANVGQALMGAIELHSVFGPLKGWSPAECPSEVVGDLVDTLDELPTEIGDALHTKAVAFGTDYLAAHGCMPDCLTVNGALFYGRIQGLEMAVDIVSAVIMPVVQDDLAKAAAA